MASAGETASDLVCRLAVQMAGSGYTREPIAQISRPSSRQRGNGRGDHDLRLAAVAKMPASAAGAAPSSRPLARTSLAARHEEAWTPRLSLGARVSPGAVDPP